MLLATASPALAATDVPFATIGGESFAEAAYLPAKFDKRYRRQIVVNRFRPVAVARLLASHGATCRLTVTPADIAAYLGWWRSELLSMAVRAEASSTQAALAPQFRRVATLVPTDAAAAEEARSEIEHWQGHACAQAVFGGDRYFVPRGLATFMGDVDPGTLFSYRVVGVGLVRPDKTLVEPVEAIGRLFAEAIAAGRISFANATDRDYLAARYTDPAFANASGPAAAAQVARPYWQEPQVP